MAARHQMLDNNNIAYETYKEQAVWHQKCPEMKEEKIAHPSPIDKKDHKTGNQSSRRSSLPKKKKALAELTRILSGPLIGQVCHAPKS